MRLDSPGLSGPAPTKSAEDTPRPARTVDSRTKPAKDEDENALKPNRDGYVKAINATAYNKPARVPARPAKTVRQTRHRTAALVVRIVRTPSTSSRYAKRVPSLDVLAYTAFKDENDHDDDENREDDREGTEETTEEMASQARTEKKKTGGRDGHAPGAEGLEEVPTSRVHLPETAVRHRETPSGIDDRNYDDDDDEDEDDEDDEDDDTAQIGERRRSAASFQQQQRRYRSRTGNYGLLFVLYLLAWPLLCTTNPPGQFATAFAQNPIGRIDNVTLVSNSAGGHRHRNLSHPSSSSSSATSLEVATYSIRRNGIHRPRTAVSSEEKYRRYSRLEVDEDGAVPRDAPAAETVHPYNEYTWEVNQINPWLSACDLAGPAPADLQGSCGPPAAPKNCPQPCKTGGQSEAWQSAKTPPSEKQCLFYLENEHKLDVCRDDYGRENRYRYMSGLRLRHCCEHAAVNALAPGRGGPLEAVLNGGGGCRDAIDRLLLVDALAARLNCEFEEVLARYDCGQVYSVIHNCTHCKEAYRKWVCSSLVPYFAHGKPQDLDKLRESWTGSRLRPCRSFCQSVEQRCPYLLPGDRAPAYPTQYAGEPTFLCMDPNIPETGEQAARALHSNDEDECCFHVCSEEQPGSGLCANCTDREAHERGRSYDPPTAPRCEINPLQTGSAGGQSSSTEKPIEDTTASVDYPSSTELSQQRSSSGGTSFCGSGGVGSMSSSGCRATPSYCVLVGALWLLATTTTSLVSSRTVGLIGAWLRFLFSWWCCWWWKTSRWKDSRRVDKIRRYSHTSSTMPSSSGTYASRCPSTARQTGARVVQRPRRLLGTHRSYRYRPRRRRRRRDGTSSTTSCRQQAPNEREGSADDASRDPPLLAPF